MKNYLSFKLLPILALAALLIIGCSKNDDDDNGAGSPAGGDNLPKEHFIVTHGNDTYSEGTLMVSTSTIGESLALNITSQFTSQNAIGEVEFLDIPNPGTYTSSTTMGFAFSKGTTAWFCGDGCQITIETHDKSAKYLKGKITGTMTTIQGASVQNISCKFGVEY